MQDSEQIISSLRASAQMQRGRHGTRCTLTPGLCHKKPNLSWELGWFLAIWLPQVVSGVNAACPSPCITHHGSGSDSVGTTLDALSH